MTGRWNCPTCNERYVTKVVSPKRRGPATFGCSNDHAWLNTPERSERGRLWRLFHRP